MAQGLCEGFHLYKSSSGISEYMMVPPESKPPRVLYQFDPHFTWKPCILCSFHQRGLTNDLGPNSALRYRHAAPVTPVGFVRTYQRGEFGSLLWNYSTNGQDCLMHIHLTDPRLTGTLISIHLFFFFTVSSSVCAISCPSSLHCHLKLRFKYFVIPQMMKTAEVC